MKKYIRIAIFVCSALLLCSCLDKKTTTMALGVPEDELVNGISENKANEEKSISVSNNICVENIESNNDENISNRMVMLPSIERIQGICELATLESYIHGVTKSVKEAGTGISHGFEKERQYWVEYYCTIKLGINMSLVEMEIDGNIVTITLPDVEILNLDMKVSEDDIVMSEDGWVNKNPITAEDQKEILEKAEKEIREKVENDDELLNDARQRAEELITNYINQLSALNEEEYVIVFK